MPLRYKLKNGDSVEILTSPGARPNKDWLGFVKTSRAQAKIRSFIKTQQRERSIDIGRDLLEREFKRFDLNFGKVVKGTDFLKAANEMDHSRPEDLVSAVGYGKLSPANVLNKLYPDAQKKVAEATTGNGEPGGNRLTELFRRVAQRTRTTGGVRIVSPDASGRVCRASVRGSRTRLAMTGPPSMRIPRERPPDAGHDSGDAIDVRLIARH